jgi:hypothetical protein
MYRKRALWDDRLDIATFEANIPAMVEFGGTTARQADSSFC